MLRAAGDCSATQSASGDGENCLWAISSTVLRQNVLWGEAGSRAFSIGLDGLEVTLRVGRVKDIGRLPLCVELAHFLLDVDPQVLVSPTRLGEEAAHR